MTQQLPITIPDATRVSALQAGQGLASLGAPATGPRFDARRMTGRGSTAEIVLDGKVYTLRITRAGKLILTK